MSSQKCGAQIIWNRFGLAGFQVHQNEGEGGVEDLGLAEEKVVADLAGFGADFDQLGSDLRVFADAEFLDEIGVGVDHNEGQLATIADVLWREGPCGLQGEPSVRAAVEVARDVHVTERIAIGGADGEGVGVEMPAQFILSVQCCDCFEFGKTVESFEAFFAAVS